MVEYMEKQVLVTLMCSPGGALVTLMLTRRCPSNIYAHQPVPQPVLSERKHLCLDDVSWARAGEKAKLLRWLDLHVNFTMTSRSPT